MTNLVERVTVTITINHDIGKSSVYGHGSDYKEIVKKIWPHLAPWAEVTDGALSLGDGAIEIKWTSTGLEEMPELAGGDN